MKPMKIDKKYSPQPKIHLCWSSLCRTNQQLKSFCFSANLMTLGTICIFHATWWNLSIFKLSYLPFGPAGMRWKRKRFTNKTSASGKSNVQLAAIQWGIFCLLEDELWNLHEFTGFVTFAATEWCALHEDALIVAKAKHNPPVCHQVANKSAF